MKKAKIFLSALTVLAVVGGALAFKAKNQFVYYTAPAGAAFCTVPALTIFSTTVPTAAVGTVITADLFGAPIPCTTKVTADL